MALEARAPLRLFADRAIAGFRQAGQVLGVALEEEDGSLLLEIAQGSVRVSGSGEGGTSRAIAAPEPAGLQITRDLVAERIAAMGLTLEWESRVGAGRPANLSLATVTDVRRLTPSYTQIIVEGPDLARFAGDRLHFRLLFGPGGAGWPTPTRAA